MTRQNIGRVGTALGAIVFALAVNARAVPADLEKPEYGVIVMAHGGSADWNEHIREAVDSIDSGVRHEIAFGMADRASLETSIRALEGAGVRRVAVVRLFVSGESFVEQTEYLLGIDDSVPDVLFDSSRSAGMRPVADPASVPPIDHSSVVRLSASGLVDAAVTGEILAERALNLSADPPQETVLVIAHGMADEVSNRRLLTALEARAETIRSAAPFRAVEVATLREDWDEPRIAAEALIRSIMREGTESGEVIVVPFRLAGFGPYAEVLEGFEYRADGMGLLPHTEITAWILRSGRDVACREGWTTRGCAPTNASIE